MKKKFLTFILSICFIIPCMFMFSACSTTTPADIEFKVENGYIQYYDGSNWNNLIAIEELEGEDGDDADIWTIGNDGYWYKNGSKTNKKAVGDIGANGNGIKSIAPSTDPAKTNATQTTYIITLDDNSTYEFVVKNGTNGEDGDDADIWTIGNDGYWYKNGIKTDDKAVGENGETPYIGSNGNWWIGQTDTNIKAQVTVTFDYNNPTFLENIGINVYEFANEKKTQQKITLSAWLDNLMPNFKNTAFEEYFQGWFIEGTNKEITQYDLIGGNITLKAKWNETNLEKYYNTGATFTYNNSSYTAYLLSEQDKIVIPQYYNDDVNGEHPVTVVNKSDVANYSQTNLTYLSLSNSIERIGEKAFYNCENLQSIKIPNNLKNVGVDAFYMNNIRNIYVDTLDVWLNIEFADKEANPMYAPYSYGEGLKTTGADLYLNNVKLTELVVGANYDEIKSFAFCDFSVEMISVNCSKLNDYAFKGCSAPLIIFNDSVTEIGKLDISRVCDSIKFGQGITSINENALSDCLGFVRITINSQTVLDTITTNSKIAGCSLSQTTTIHIKNDLDTTSLTGLTNYFETTGTYGDCDVWTRK